MFFSTNAIYRMARECERQQVGPLAVFRLSEAINYAYQNYTGPLTVDFILTLGTRVDPANTDFRHTPVVFKEYTSSAAPHSEIPRMLSAWCEMVNDAIMKSPRMDTQFCHSLIKEFLHIHPFKDGNGRVAFVLNNMISGIIFERFVQNHCVLMLYKLPEFNWS